MTDTELIIIVQLYNALDLDRMSVIEKGISVELSYVVKIYKERFLLPDELISYKKNQNTYLDSIKVVNNLTYDYVTKTYIIKTTKNYLPGFNIKKFYAGDNLKESYYQLNNNFFNTFVPIYLDLKNINLSKKYKYYVKIYAVFKAITIYPFPIKLPNPFNFITDIIKRRIE